MPKVTIEFDHSEVGDAIRLLMKMEDIAAGYDGSVETPRHTISGEPLTEAEEQVLEEVIAEHSGEEPTVLVEATPKPRLGTPAALLPEEGAGKSAADKLIEKAEADERKVALAVQTADKKRVGVGKEVKTPLGVGVIEATYRGQAVVSFEDGSAAMVMSRDLTVNLQEDAPTEEATKAPAEKPPEEDLLMSESQWTTLRDLAGKFCNEHKAKPEEIVALLKEYGVSKFEDLPSHAYEVMKVGIEALAGVEDAGAGYGF